MEKNSDNTLPASVVEENPGPETPPESEKSKFEKITNKLGQLLLGSDKSGKMLEEICEKGGLTVNEQYIPASYKYEPEDQTALNLFRGLIDAAGEKSTLANWSESALQNAVGTLQPKKKRTLPDHYVSAPIKFGTLEELDEKALKSFRDFKKDCGSKVSIEIVLEFINSFLQSKKNIYSEKAIIDNLHSILPHEALQYLSSMKKQNRSLADIYEFLCFHMGTHKSREMIAEELYQLAESKDPPLKVLEQMAKLLNLAGKDTETINTACINEARRFLKKTRGELIVAQIDAQMRIDDTNSFFDLFKIASQFFSHELGTNTKRMHEITAEATATGICLLTKEIENLKNEIKDLRSSQTHNINQTTSNPPIICYTCNKPGHISKQCFKNLKKPGQSSYNSNNNNNIRTVAYYDDRCHIHTNSNHKNRDCRNQQSTPCSFNQNHNTHNSANCRRSVPAMPRENRQINFRPQPTNNEQSGYNLPDPKPQNIN